MASDTRTAASPVVADNVGDFVRTDAFGIGRLVDLTNDIARVRYFQAPGRSPYVEQPHSASEVSAVTLPTHARAYLHDGRRWRIGRVDGVHPQDPAKYLIAFPNADGAVLPTESFDVRWQLPITDPFDVLEAVGGDSPVVYEARLDLLAEWSRQRAAATGVDGLELGSVELHRHQLAVVRRIAADPVQRYLLADEVGLGKTIEAGALIWQFLARRPSGRILVLAPDHLRQQWAAELLDRFRIDEFADAWLRIRSHSDEATWPDQPVDLLVVDEAHHATRTGLLFATARQRIVELAHEAEALLLLSATPVRSNEAGFLDLLHLLDPENYKPDQLEDFVRRVELRDHLALTYQALTPDIDEFDLSLYAGELTNLFPDDSTLSALLTEATVAADLARPTAVERVREHLSETYRLHHRLLRTRRTSEVGATFAVRGRKRAVPFTLEVSDLTDGLRSQLVDSVRLHVTAALEHGALDQATAVNAFRDVAARCGSLPHALLPLVDDDNEDPSSTNWKLVRQLVEPEALAGWRQLIHDVHDAHVAILQELGDVLSRATIARGVARTVVTSAFTETAEAITEEISRRWGPDRVAAHLSTHSRDENSAELGRWADDGPCSVLVCDAGAEEGINLQSADLLIHVDLPWEAFRVEQRIGRCDRHAPANRGPIPSAVVTFGDQPYAIGWFEFLADGCEVFSRSVSSLQYVLGDTERSVQTSALMNGASVLADAIDTQASTLAVEQTRIVAHDALDSIDRSNAPEVEDPDEALLASDRRSTLTDSLVSWLDGVGAKVRRVSPGVVRLERKPRPQVPFDLELALAPFMETPLAVDRHAAVARAIPVLRADHPMVDAVATHLMHSDRGVAFALFRPARGQWPPAIVLRTDFLVSAAPADSFLAEVATLGLGTWVSQLLRELLPPVVETVVITTDGTEVTHPALRQPYDKQRGDRNLSSRPELFDRLTAHIDWPDTCASALDSSRAVLAQRSAITERPQQGASALRARIERRIDRDRSRELAGLHDSGLDLRQLGDRLPECFDTRVDVMGCGVLLVGDPARLV
ncbi:MAG: ATP-dependent helicase HepA [Actinomycetota bacterium]|jgi:ATP-dependent helicase HepA|nr:ATP-dependent helicase HepA [Actinomycetota bacterium]